MTGSPSRPITTPPVYHTVSVATSPQMGMKRLRHQGQRFMPSMPRKQTPMSQRLTTLWHNTRPVLLKGGLIVIILFALFEIGVRVLPPDAVQYDVEANTDGRVTLSQSGIMTDPTTIAQWRAAVTASPTNETLIGALIHAWRKDEICAPLSTFTASYVFLWHGLPLESVTLLSICGEESTISSGGIPDPRTYNMPILLPAPH